MNTVVDKENKMTERKKGLGMIENEVDEQGQFRNVEGLEPDPRDLKSSSLKEIGESRRNKKDQSQTTSEVFRVVISREANECLEETLVRCSEGFEGATLTKSDIANYVFQNLPRLFVDSDVKALRAVHFDEKKVLGSLLKNDDQLPDDLRKAIRAHFGIAVHERDRKRPAKPSLS